MSEIIRGLIDHDIGFGENFILFGGEEISRTRFTGQGTLEIKGSFEHVHLARDSRLTLLLHVPFEASASSLLAHPHVSFSGPGTLVLSALDVDLDISSRVSTDQVLLKSLSQEFTLTITASQLGKFVLESGTGLVTVKTTRETPMLISHKSPNVLLKAKHVSIDQDSGFEDVKGMLEENGFVRIEDGFSYFTTFESAKKFNFYGPGRLVLTSLQSANLADIQTRIETSVQIVIGLDRSNWKDRVTVRTDEQLDAAKIITGNHDLSLDTASAAIQQIAGKIRIETSDDLAALKILTGNDNLTIDNATHLLRYNAASIKVNTPEKLEAARRICRDQGLTLDTTRNMFNSVKSTINFSDTSQLTDSLTSDTATAALRRHYAITTIRVESLEENRSVRNTVKAEVGEGQDITFFRNLIGQRVSGVGVPEDTVLQAVSIDTSATLVSLTFDKEVTIQLDFEDERQLTFQRVVPDEYIPEAQRLLTERTLADVYLVGNDQTVEDSQNAGTSSGDTQTDEPSSGTTTGGY